MKYTTIKLGITEKAESDALTNLCDDFNSRISEKILEQLKRGWGGWDDPEWTQIDILDRIQEQIGRQNIDPIDIAILAMFL